MVKHVFIKDLAGNYLTKKSVAAEFSFTNNKAFAYVFDTEEQAQAVIKLLGLEANVAEG